MITLACLDMAGTTVADDGAVLAAFDAALARVGLEPGAEGYSQARDYAITTMGQSKIEVFRFITGEEQAAHLANEAFETAYAGQLASGGAQPVAGALETFKSLRDSGIRVALTTGFSPSTRDAIIEILGWSDEVDLALSPADAGRGRPYPDMVLTAAVRLGVDDVRHLAVAGDTTSDLLAGHRAGASVIAGVLTGTHGAKEFAASPHTHILDSVADLPDLLAATSNAA